MSGFSTPRTPESEPEESLTTDQKEKRRMSSAPPPMAVSNLRRKSPKGVRSYADMGDGGIMTVSQDKKALTTLRMKKGLENLSYSKHHGNGDQDDGNEGFNGNGGFNGNRGFNGNAGFNGNGRREYRGFEDYQGGGYGGFNEPVRSTWDHLDGGREESKVQSIRKPFLNRKGCQSMVRNRTFYAKSQNNVTMDSGRKSMEDLKDWSEDGDTDVVDAVKGAMNELCPISMEAGDCLEQRRKRN